VKLLIIGKTGQLGSALLEDAIRAGHDVFAPKRHGLDISNELSFRTAVKSVRPDFVINTAAYHNVPLCEVETAKAFQLNCVAVKKMAEVSNEFNSWFISFSTDYVFNGKKKDPYVESDMPRPLQMYGISKLAGEFAALSCAPDSTIIIRTCGLYGLVGANSKGGNFVDNRIADARQNKMIEVSNEQTISPTFAGDLSTAVLQLIVHPLKGPGIYHLVNQGYCTWYEFTRMIFNILNIDTAVLPVDREGKTNNMRRPLFSALKNERAAKLGIDLRHWEEGLRDYINLKYIDNARPGTR